MLVQRQAQHHDHHPIGTFSKEIRISREERSGNIEYFSSGLVFWGGDNGRRGEIRNGRQGGMGVMKNSENGGCSFAGKEAGETVRGNLINFL